jgi:hypothetical protein
MDECHEWIKSDLPLKRSFQTLIDSFSDKTAHFFNESAPLLFVAASGTLACSLNASHEENIIIVFPDLHRMLRSSSPSHGIAVLAHELGHIFYEHSRKKIPPLKAQIQADRFAFELGFAEELRDILLDYPDSEDCRLRLYYLGLLIEKKEFPI